MSKLKVLGYNLYISSLDKINILEKVVISTVNPYSYMMSKKDLTFYKALQESDILLPDGVGIVQAVRILNQASIKRVTGYDAFRYFMGKYSSGRIFFLGSTESTLQKIRLKAANDYPDSKLGFYSPPFADEFTETDTDIMIEKINTFAPNVLFVGMTAPKQEKWVYKNKDKINSKVIASIGAVFDYYAGNVRRPPQVLIDLGLEWFFRFLQEPGRLWKRNFIVTPLFIWEIFTIKLINNLKQ